MADDINYSKEELDRLKEFNSEKEKELNNNTITPYLKPNGSMRSLTKEYIHLINSERSYFYNKIKKEYDKINISVDNIDYCKTDEMNINEKYGGDRFFPKPILEDVNRNLIHCFLLNYYNTQYYYYTQRRMDLNIIIYYILLIITIYRYLLNNTDYLLLNFQL